METDAEAASRRPAGANQLRERQVKTSLIITTYNWKEALELVLLSASSQSEPPDEALVADDGSREDTGELIRRMAAVFPFPLLHVWQEDKGFRAAAIRNRAIARASGDYILLVDGDAILHRNFVKDHKAAARDRQFCQGSRVLLTPQKTALALARKQLVFSPFEGGLKNRKNAVVSPFLSTLFSFRRDRLKGVRTCNFAFWREDGIEVNGFNEDFVGYAREDSEFAVRLMNSGVRRRTLRFVAPVYHLHHPFQSRSAMEVHDAILKESVGKKLTWRPNGIDKHLE